MNEEFFTEVLEQNKAAVKAAVVNAMMESIKRKFEWELPEEISKTVNEFIKTEVLPEVKAELMKNKDVFVDSATSIVRGIPVELGKALQEQVAKNLANSWNLKNLVEGLLR